MQLCVKALQCVVAGASVGYKQQPIGGGLARELEQSH